MALNLMELLTQLGVTQPQPGSNFMGGQSGLSPDALTGAAPQAAGPPPPLAAPPPDPTMTGLASASSPMLDQAAGIVGQAVSTPAGVATAAAPPPQAPPLAVPASVPSPAPDAAASAQQTGTWGLPLQPDIPAGNAPPPQQRGGAGIQDPLAGKGYGYVPQMTWPERLMLIAGAMKDFGDVGIGGPGGHFDQTLGGIRQWNLSMAQRQQRQQMLQNGLFANDPLNQYGFLWAPDKVTDAAAERVKPTDLRAGGMYLPGEPGSGGGPPIYNAETQMYGNAVISRSPEGAKLLGYAPPSSEDIKNEAGAVTDQYRAVTGRQEAQTAQQKLQLDAWVAKNQPDWENTGYLDANQQPLFIDKKSNQYRTIPIAVDKPSAAAGALNARYRMLVASGTPPNEAMQRTADPSGTMTDTEVERRAADAVSRGEVSGTYHVQDRAKNVQAWIEQYRQAEAADRASGAPPTNPYAPPGSAPRVAGAAGVTGQ